MISKTNDLDEKNRIYGYVNQQGVEVIPLRYTDARGFSEGLAAVKAEKWGFINTTGKTIIALQYDNALFFVDGKALVAEGNKRLILSPKGKVLKTIAFKDPDANSHEEREHDSDR